MKAIEGFSMKQDLSEIPFIELRKEYYKRLKEFMPIKEKPITCRTCKYKISSTDLNKKYKKKGLRKHLGGEFDFGLYCQFKKENNEPVKIFDGLKQLACENYELKDEKES